MRNGQNNKRMRGRNNNHSHNNNNNNRKGQNPMTRVYESNGPDVKIRGNAMHVAEKYIQLARDAQSSGDPVAAENYFQHAEHYFRLIAAAQEQFRQSQPQFYRPENEGQARNDEANFDDGEDDASQPNAGEPFNAGGQQPYMPRDAQPYPQQQPRDPQAQPQHQPRQQQPQHVQQPQSDVGSDVGGLPSFITGGQPQPQQPPHNNGGQNGYDNNQPDRFPLHRRRRRHRGHRPDLPGGGPDQGPARDNE